MKLFFSAMMLLSITCVSLAASTAVVNVSGTVVFPTCSINSGQAISLYFGNDVLTTSIDGKEYKKLMLPYKIDCDGDMTGFSVMKITIAGNTASFGNGLLKTSKDGLAVQFISNGNNFPINTSSAEYDYISGNAPGIEAVLAKSPSITLTGGVFSATASLQLSYL